MNRLQSHENENQFHNYQTGSNLIIESKQKRYQKRSRHLPILNFHNEYLNFMKLSSKQSKKGGI